MGPNSYRKPEEEEIKKKLSPMSFAVTQDQATEPAFSNAYYMHFDPGIYVDVVTGEPLFSSKDKYHSGSGWPAFAKPLHPQALKVVKDVSHGMVREEVRSAIGDSHLGHVFPDGPAEKGGMRYCINSAALRFVPFSDMEKEGYGSFLVSVE